MEAQPRGLSIKVIERYLFDADRASGKELAVTENSRYYMVEPMKTLSNERLLDYDHILRGLAGERRDTDSGPMWLIRKT